MEIKERILKALEQIYPRDITIKEITKRLRVSRMTMGNM
jgi:DNA-binding Lrp family transcriptional regulator